MVSLEFLNVISDQNYIPPIKDLFARFQQEKQISDEPNLVGWDAIWREVVEVGIYQCGADVMEVGTTWLES